MYDILRYDVQPCTTMFDNVRQCSTMYANVRQKILPYDRVFVSPKSFTCKTFFYIRSIAYENLRLTATNRDISRQHTKNYNFLFRTLSHLKLGMWRPALVRQHIFVLFVPISLQIYSIVPCLKSYVSRFFIFAQFCGENVIERGTC